VFGRKRNPVDEGFGRHCTAACLRGMALGGHLPHYWPDNWR